MNHKEKKATKNMCEVSYEGDAGTVLDMQSEWMEKTPTMNIHVETKRRKKNSLTKRESYRRTINTQHQA